MSVHKYRFKKRKRDRDDNSCHLIPEYERFEKEIKSLKLQLETQNNRQLLYVTETKVTGLERKIENLVKESKPTELNVETNSKQLDELREQLNALKQLLKSSDDDDKKQLDELNKRVINLRDEMRDLDTRLKSNFTKVNADLSKFETRIDELNSKLDDVHENMKRMTDEILPVSTYREEMKKLIEKGQNVNKTLVELDEEIKKITKQLQELETSDQTSGTKSLIKLGLLTFTRVLQSKLIKLNETGIRELKEKFSSLDAKFEQLKSEYEKRTDPKSSSKIVTFEKLLDESKRICDELITFIHIKTAKFINKKLSQMGNYLPWRISNFLKDIHYDVIRFRCKSPFDSNDYEKESKHTEELGFFDQVINWPYDRNCFKFHFPFNAYIKAIRFQPLQNNENSYFKVVRVNVNHIPIFHINVRNNHIAIDPDFYPKLPEKEAFFTDGYPSYSSNDFLTVSSKYSLANAKPPFDFLVTILVIYRTTSLTINHKFDNLREKLNDFEISETNRSKLMEEYKQWFTYKAYSTKIIDPMLKVLDDLKEESSFNLDVEF